MSDVYVIESLRTPLGSFGGELSDVEAPRLAAAVIRELVGRSGLPADAVGEVIVGQVLSGGAGQAPARQAMRYAELPDTIPAMTINKVCGSGLKALMLGADSIQLGNADVVIAGGMENMSLAPYLLGKGRYGYRMGNGELIDLLVNDGLLDPYSGNHMGVIAEATTEKHGISRVDQDAFAFRSYQKAQAAVKEGIFRDEIVPVVKKGRKGEVTVSDDEEPFKVDFTKIAGLRGAFKKDGTVTAGNASSINDGAALTLLASGEAVKKYGLKPKARLIAYASNSQHPDQFTEAPVGAIEKALVKAGLKTSDIDLFEINEAFAAVTMLAIRQLGLDPEKVNVNGGAVAIGHPLGASGGRLAATIVRELHRRQARYGLATLCIGGGEAVAAIFERV
ncbi:thiolase family protein [Geobacter hydrogenophilus]|uniref:Acetyl-CoA acetyltransferase n=1 Tax=Geobacter hydrogenophilus TaxID=40983 RepID=A0A9W6LDT5_9BACT|nr:thiolase family protein [Geobacter hydrogenophilus]MBT0895609.1 thiolase family protein [Geobacter hydrogenophilus]GLI39300.1 acetyl-CoA acetyltransferase [Geobacter hydrogenophilus]